MVISSSAIWGKRAVNFGRRWVTKWLAIPSGMARRTGRVWPCGVFCSNGICSAASSIRSAVSISRSPAEVGS